jgi:hypothetical protein
MPSTVCVGPMTAGLSMELTLRETDRAFHTINCAISYINPLYRTAISLYKRCVSAQTVGASIRILCMLRRCEAARRCDDERREPETRRHDAVATLEITSMRTPASIARDPIHPMLVVLPIGLWIFSLICDLIDLSVATSAVWFTVALYATAGGRDSSTCS